MPKISQIDVVPCQAKVRILQKITLKGFETGLEAENAMLICPVYCLSSTHDINVACSKYIANIWLHLAVLQQLSACHFHFDCKDTCIHILFDKAGWITKAAHS